MSSRPSVLARFRLTGVSVIIGVGLVGALFYGLVSSHYLGRVISQTLGPFSDSVAEAGFSSDEPDIWQRIAARHGVAMVVETADGEILAYNDRGEPTLPETLDETGVRAVRSRPDGRRVTLHWTLGWLGGNHWPLLSGLLVMVTSGVGAAFWFLQRQLKPLAALQSGVEAVARGDFATRVPVVRNDEIGQVAVAFNTMTRRVGEMIDDRERLLGDVSHELRSPLARMKVALELMPEGAKRDAVAADVREMENLIAVLLEREALRSRADRLEGESVDLMALAGEVVAAFADQGPGVELASTEPVTGQPVTGQPVAGQPVTVQADPTLVKLLLQNLVDNAVKFSHPDSTPVVVQVVAESGEVGGTVRLSVLDDGIGLPPGDDEQLFEAFVKGDRSRGHHVGYGLGLNLCQRIVQLHGGTIRLRPRQLRGTEAVVRLR